MFDKLDFISDKYDELSRIVSDPSVISNQTVWQKHVRELSGLEPIVKKYTEYKKVKDSITTSTGKIWCRGGTIATGAVQVLDRTTR